MLDIGALGVMMPAVNSAQEALEAVQAVRYPPDGTRGFGPTFAALRWGLTGADYVQQANDEVMAIVQIERIDAVERIEGILAVPGLDLPLIGRVSAGGAARDLHYELHRERKCAAAQDHQNAWPFPVR